MPFWSKSLAQEIRRLAALDQRSGMTFYEVKDEARHVAAQLLDLDDAAYARTLRDLLNRPGGLFRAYHLPAAVYGSPRARATLRTADDVRLVAGILLQAYGRSSSPLQAAPFPFLMGPLESILGGAVEAVDVKDPGLERAMPVLTDLLALEHPALAGVTGRCARRLPELSRAAFDSLLRRWSETGGRLGRQIAVIRTAAESNHDLFEALVLLLLDAPQPEPTQEWQRCWSALRLRAAGMPLRQLLIAVIEVELSPSGALVGEPESMTRGAIWALASWDDADARDLLESIVLAAVPSDVLANAAIWSLAHPNDEQSLVRLQRVGDRVRHRGLKTRALEALRRAAAARDTTPESLADQLVADQGLDEHGERYWELGAYRFRIRLGTDGGVERTITGPDGESRSALPKSVQDAFRDAWREIVTTTVQLKSTLTTQKHRLDEAMSDGRRWSSGAWQASIAAHPVMVRLAARLVWRAAFDGREEFVMPTPTGEWETHDRRRLTIPANANLSIPHVLEIPAAEQEGWQRRIVLDGIVQPFRQLFREVYAVTPVERQAGDHSSRFAGHSVPLAQVYALTKTRGWKGKLGLAGFYGAGEGWKEFPTRHLRVGLRHGGDDPQLNLGVVEEVFFERSQGSSPRKTRWQRIPLTEVEPVVFSEAMRDVDLIVSAASLGREFTPVQWEALHEREREAWVAAQPQAEYLTQASAQVRGKLLLELASLLGIQDRVHVDGHFAVVQGKLGGYRVHLGTSGVYMEPSRRALCIVPAKEEARRIHLPFEEGDYKTSLVFSKILMLLDDDKINDPTILRQMDRPG